MTDTPPQSTISETCRCGGSISVTAPTLDAARRQVERWRNLGHAGCALSTPHGAGFRLDPRSEVR